MSEEYSEFRTKWIIIESEFFQQKTSDIFWYNVIDTLGAIKCVASELKPISHIYGINVK